MSFSNVAKDLLKTPVKNEKESPLARANVLVKLAESGFSQEDIFRRLDELYDEASDDPSVRRQILDMVIKVHGMYKDEDKREAPVFNFNINGDRGKMLKMLCPLMPEENAA